MRCREIGRGFLSLVFAITACRAFAVQPSNEEMQLAQKWTARCFGTRGVSMDEAPNGKSVPSFGGELPFSFTYNGSTKLQNQFLYSESSIGPHPTVKSHQTPNPVLATSTLKDIKTGLVVRCDSKEFIDFPAVDWVLRFHNTGAKPTPIIEDVQPLDWTFPRLSSASVHITLGDSNSAKSFAPSEVVLKPGSSFVAKPNGGRSSDGYLPFFNIQTPTGGVVLAIGWSGQWKAQFDRAANGDLRVRAGMEHTHFVLNPGESVRTPRILLLFWKGSDPARGTNLFRQLLLAHYVPRRNGKLVFPPICGSVTVAAPDGSYEGPHLKIMPVLAERGYEVFWSDMDPQQWYPGGFPNGTGTWTPDPKKYPHGLKPIGEAAHAAGLGYLLWFEPERVAPGTYIDKVHPEWVARPPKPGMGLFRLDIPKARKWLTNYIDKQVTAANLDWFRCDFNIQPLDYWRRTDTPNRQGITEMKYIAGLYAMWDDLRARHPGLMIDDCASGGRRIDLETLSRSIPLWHSDLQCTGPHPIADQLQNGGLTAWVPFHGCAVFAFDPSYIFRSEMTAGNIICASNAIGPNCIPDKSTEQPAKNTIALYKKLRPYMIGDFYPLFPHSTRDDVWYGYQFHRPDLDAGIAFIFRRKNSNQPTKDVFLRAVKPNTNYHVELNLGPTPHQQCVSGLTPLRITIPTAPGAMIVEYSPVKNPSHQAN